MTIREMKISASHQFLPKSSSVRAAMVMDHFGIDFEQGRHVIAEDLELPVQPNEIVLFTGESGSGKSTLMKSVRAQLEMDGNKVIAMGELTLEDKILVDSLDLPLEQALQLLSACGLGEAHLLLRTPAELSDGQRYRFLLARALATQADWIVADEYTATLDRTLAKVVSLNLRKLANRSAVGFLLATTHEDILADLAPDLHIHCRLDGGIQVNRNIPADLKKKASPSQRTCGFPPPPNPTGRTSLGGITAVTNLG